MGPLDKEYSEPRYIQNAGLFKTWGIYRTLSHIYNEAHKYNYFRKACRDEINLLR